MKTILNQFIHPVKIINAGLTILAIALLGLLFEMTVFYVDNLHIKEFTAFWLALISVLIGGFIVVILLGILYYFFLKIFNIVLSKINPTWLHSITTVDR